MSRYIVDASIMVQYVIADRHTVHVDMLFEDVGNSITIYVPDFCLLECANVLWKQVRFNNVAPVTADEHLKDLLDLDIIIVQVIDLLPRALEIGLQHQLAVYDSVYIALAEDLGHPLITDDDRQARAAQAEGITLKPVTDFTP